MTIEEVHLRAIARELLLRMLQEGIIPTAEQLARFLEKRTEGLELNQPEFSQNNPEVEYGEAASASKFNRLSREMVGGLHVLYNSYLEAERNIADVSERTLLELQRLSRKSKALISRVNRLLLTTEKTGGLLNIVGDDFTDTSLVDLDRTTVHVDLEAQAIHNRFFRREDPNLLDSMDTTGIENADITITPLDPVTRRNPGTRDSERKDIFSPSDQPWLYTVSTPTPGPSPIEVRIDFRNAIVPPADNALTYKIVLDPYVTNNSLQALIQHSMDGITWEDLPVVDPLRRIASPTVYMVDGLEFRYLRIVMTRDTFSRLGREGEYIHDFGIRRLVVHSVRNIYEAGSEFYSGQHIILDENGNRKKFTKASLSVACEHIEPDTEIDYLLGS